MKALAILSILSLTGCVVVEVEPGLPRLRVEAAEVIPLIQRNTVAICGFFPDNISVSQLLLSYDPPDTPVRAAGIICQAVVPRERTRGVWIVRGVAFRGRFVDRF